MSDVTLNITVGEGKVFPHCSECGPLPPLDLDADSEFDGIDIIVAEHMTLTHNVTQISRQDNRA